MSGRLLYNYFRDCYDPVTGRYCQADPLGLRGGDLSLYLYARNNPLSFTDPLGLQATRVRPSTPPGGGGKKNAKPVYPPGFSENPLNPWTETKSEARIPTWQLPKNPLDCEERYKEDKEQCMSNCGDGSIGAQTLCLFRAWVKYRACLLISDPSDGSDSGLNW